MATEAKRLASVDAPCGALAAQSGKDEAVSGLTYIYLVCDAAKICPAQESGRYRCERLDQHGNEGHWIGFHTIAHARVGNGYACSSVESCPTCDYPRGEPEPARCPDCGH